MKKTKYPINREFFPYSKFTPTLNRTVISLSKKFLKVPKFLWKDPELYVQSVMIPGYQSGEFELLLISPVGIKAPAPCFLNIHGGGFVFEGVSSHYRHAIRYAKEANCVVAYARYRLAPEFPFPYPQEDSYAALKWLYDNAEELGIDPDRIGVGGDSAGGTLSVAACMMARDRALPHRPLFQMLIYPFLDGRNTSDSYKRFQDAPMWNSSLSEQVGPLINPNPELTPLAYRSPVEADSFNDLPPAYIEVAEFDCLHDDGILYSELLRDAGIETELHQPKGTMHGFDSKVSAPTTQKMVSLRVKFMKRMFEN